jgi:aminoglycoside phosphotransferase (APT) family kinase protein
VSFDWGAAHLGPAEEDFEVLLRRDFAGDKAGQAELVREYLDAYGSLTGRAIAYDAFMARMPWARLICTLRYIVDNLDSLRWMGWQSRSPYLIHALVRAVRRALEEVAT